MEIFILRHGKAEDNSSNISSDSKRSLTEEGKNELKVIGKGLKNLGIEIDSIFSSPLVRAKETAEIISPYLQKKKKQIIIWDELKPESNFLDIHKKLVKLPHDAKILLVGHEPHLTTLISSIISPECVVSINLKKGGLVIIRAKSLKSKIIGSLRSVLTPKQLKLCK